MKRTKIVTALASVRPSTASPVTLDSPPVGKFTERFLELRRQGFRDLVDMAVELGEILIQARPLLRGVYQKWLREHLGVDPATAENYVALARLSKEAPHVIQRWKELGPTKLYRVARLPPPGRSAIFKVRGLADMTDGEFVEVTARYLVRRRKVTGNMRAHGLRMKVQGFTQRLARTRLPAIEDDQLRSDLRRDLVELARRVRELLGKL